GGLFDIDSLRCNTTGGCLFDRSMCSYRNSDLADKASFRMVSVLNQRFVQASVPPGGIAILEVETRFHEAHLVVFDLLEFSEGGKLSACCLKPQNQPQELFCPFATESQATPVLWHTSRITCPSGTTKLMFVCENYGQLQGSCSIDNIRLHKTVDVLELEPCQKNTLRST
uniref:MAM domain-containing protein n=1 Tax=Parascaris univalens TaxID=6257 RepID=A0A914ZF42_PARUN